MIKVQEALKAAIELIQNCDIHTGNLLDIATTLDQCKAALSELDKCYGENTPVSEPREWVGLNRLDIENMYGGSVFDVIKRVEAKLKQLNTGVSHVNTKG